MFLKSYGRIRVEKESAINDVSGGNNDTSLKDEKAASRHGFKDKYRCRVNLLGITTEKEKRPLPGMTGSQIFSEQ